ncbi:tripartite tricarboxylate transporter permease [Campylobacter fetus]|uniref:tripartite tricarboxylate transporter permease n=1 Tax=Campylobacter fetus TaxID=196 RepID=UPI001913A7FF|nr:tripartite tricarboxylate transporter permease [Campylobacter fetus]
MSYIITYNIYFRSSSRIVSYHAMWYYGAEFGGRISSILLNVPGDAGAVFTTKEHLEKEI